MSEVLQVIKERYSCRSYNGEALTKEQVEALAFAAVAAPSAMNKQPWQIVVVTNKTMIDEMNDTVMEYLSKQEDKTVYERMMGRGGKVFYNAPFMMFIAQKEGTALDTGIVVENVALTATSMGLDNVICGMARLLFETEKAEYYKETLIPEGYEFGVAILVGHGLAEGGTPHEPDFSKIRYIQ